MIDFYVRYNMTYLQYGGAVWVLINNYIWYLCGICFAAYWYIYSNSNILRGTFLLQRKSFYLVLVWEIVLEQFIRNIYVVLVIRNTILEVQGFQKKMCFFTLHRNLSFAYIAVRDLQSSQRNASVQSLLLAGDFLYEGEVTNFQEFLQKTQHLMNIALYTKN